MFYWLRGEYILRSRRSIGYAEGEFPTSEFFGRYDGAFLSFSVEYWADFFHLQYGNVVYGNVVGAKMAPTTHAKNILEMGEVSPVFHGVSQRVVLAQPNWSLDSWITSWPES